jgi:hypothetical protein
VGADEHWQRGERSFLLGRRNWSARMVTADTDDLIARYEPKRGRLARELRDVENVLRCLKMAAAGDQAGALTTAALDRAREAVARSRCI